MKRHPHITLLITYAIAIIAMIALSMMTSCASHSAHSYKYPKHM